ncbi:hypothetical protein EMIHUDRAFT_234545 [Emiliania huxleyi CCMP1516]|uniref:Uncharacterized protein n=2 Tax=Emiliania huxleyi TaxID=2903 RepID=A0A0D3JZC2_EMIH1|nr:hypothetical protein EMIHUDRAFT_234545 [Emiliania huxleyi CCMP1516]EOD28857.1 hypothetical protein EMIHUDRAFT_234545 [Emiliania huxleyi CCMP1516]|eukprot:XP_005781286.1 hypothetical protein EMIHUDRAFT_234545 [Emiliania huxleyi CCMP1516]
MSHWRYELCITYPYYASLSGACTWEGYGLRITYPYYVSLSGACMWEGYGLRITYPYYVSLSGACTWEGYGLRITYPYYVSSAESPPERAMYYALRIRIIAESPPERAMYYALRIRIMYQAPKARRRGLCTTHYASVLCIKRRKPAGEGYVLRITYPYYVSSAESPPERAMYYALHPNFALPLGLP